MDERFEDPSDEVEEEDAVADGETTERRRRNQKNRVAILRRQPKIGQLSREPHPRPILIRLPVKQERQMTNR